MKEGERENIEDKLRRILGNGSKQKHVEELMKIRTNNAKEKGDQRNLTSLPGTAPLPLEWSVLESLFGSG